MAQSKSRITSIGELRTAEDVRDFILKNDHLYDTAVLEGIKQRVGFYDAIREANVVRKDVLPEAPEPEPEPEEDPELEPEEEDPVIVTQFTLEGPEEDGS